DQVELDVEALAGVADGVHAGLIRHPFDGRVAVRADGVGQDQHRDHHADDGRQVQEDRQVGVEVEGLHERRTPSPDFVTVFTKWSNKKPDARSSWWAKTSSRPL